MLLSVIIPVYNTKEYLRACVKSCLSRSFDDYEILIVDDGSTDSETPLLCDSIASEHPGLVRVIHQKNKGLGGARNTGTAEAKGEYLFFVDSDDTLTEGAVDIIVKRIKETNSDIIAFDIYTDNGSGNRVPLDSSYIRVKEPFSLSEHPEFLLSLPNAWSRVWKRTLYTENGIEYPERAWYEDIRTTSKLFAAAESITTTEDRLYVYLQREGSIMRSANLERNVEIIDAFEDLLGWYRNKGLFDRYKEELCQLTLLNVFVAASVRVLMIDTKHPLLAQFREYLTENFPDYKSNKYIDCIPKMKKLAYKLLCKKRYKLLRLLFKIKK